MSLNFWINVLVCALEILAVLLLRAWFAIAVWLIRQAMRLVRTEQIGTVAQHAYSRSRQEDEWLPCQQFTDPVTEMWPGVELSVLVHRNVPALPYVCIHLVNGSHLWCECTVGEYEAWVDGTRLQVDEYSLGGWTLYTTEAKLVA